MKQIVTTSNLLFITLLAAIFWPSAGPIPWYLLAVAIAVESITRIRLVTVKNEVSRRGTGDVSAILFVVLLAWYLATTRFVVLDTMLFPQPDVVFKLFVSELPDMLKGLVNSLILLVSGYLLALTTALPLGLLVGWRVRLFHAVNPLTKVLGHPAEQFAARIRIPGQIDIHAVDLHLQEAAADLLEGARLRDLGDLERPHDCSRAGARSNDGGKLRAFDDRPDIDRRPVGIQVAPDCEQDVGIVKAQRRRALADRVRYRVQNQIGRRIHWPERNKGRCRLRGTPH